MARTLPSVGVPSGLPALVMLPEDLSPTTRLLVILSEWTRRYSPTYAEVQVLIIATQESTILSYVAKQRGVKTATVKKQVQCISAKIKTRAPRWAQSALWYQRLIRTRDIQSNQGASRIARMRSEFAWVFFLSELEMESGVRIRRRSGLHRRRSPRAFGTWSDSR